MWMKRLMLGAIASVAVLVGVFASSDSALASCNPGRQTFDLKQAVAGTDTGNNLRVIEGTLQVYNPYVQPGPSPHNNTSTLWIMMAEGSVVDKYIQVGFRKKEGDTVAAPWIQWNNGVAGNHQDFFFPEYYAEGDAVAFQIRYNGGTRYDVSWGSIYQNDGTLYWKYSIDLNWSAHSFQVAAEKINYNDQLMGSVTYPAYAGNLRWIGTTGGWQDFHLDNYLNPDHSNYSGVFYGNNVGFYDKKCAS